MHCTYYKWIHHLRCWMYLYRCRSKTKHRKIGSCVRTAMAQSFLSISHYSVWPGAKVVTVALFSCRAPYSICHSFQNIKRLKCQSKRFRNWREKRSAAKMKTTIVLQMNGRATEASAVQASASESPPISQVHKWTHNNDGNRDILYIERHARSRAASIGIEIRFWEGKFDYDFVKKKIILKRAVKTRKHTERCKERIERRKKTAQLIDDIGNECNIIMWCVCLCVHKKLEKSSSLGEGELFIWCISTNARFISNNSNERKICVAIGALHLSTCVR